MYSRRVDREGHRRRRISFTGVADEGRTCPHPSCVEVGTAIATGYGDGIYTVEARYIVDAGGDRRVAEVRIRFIDAADH